MITKKKNIAITGTHQKPILTDVFYTQETSRKPIVIFCHGYKGFKDWGAWDLVAETFAQNDLFFVKFNFSHNGGTLEQPLDFTDLEAFGHNNYIKELDDLDCILEWVTSSDFDFEDQVDCTRIILIGHSRGGGITTIKAAEDSRVTKLVTWAGASDYESRFPKGDVLALWKKEGVIYIENGRTKQQMPHYFQFYSSFLQHRERLHIAKAVAKINIPHLIAHGTNDSTVLIDEAKKMHHWNPNSELFLLEGANHVFGAKHPWDNSDLPKELRVLTQKTIDFTIL